MLCLFTLLLLSDVWLASALIHLIHMSATLRGLHGCRYRGVSRKKGRWEAKVMVDRRWAFRDLYDSETEAAQAYDDALWRLKPEFASSYANFKDGELLEYPSPCSGVSVGQKTRCQPKCACTAAEPSACIYLGIVTPRGTEHATDKAAVCTSMINRVRV